MCCMKHVGLNVAADPLFTAAYAGVNGGLVFAVADDPGLFSSQNDQDSRFYALSAHVPMLEPSDSAECFEFAQKAFELSEKYDTPVILRLTTRVSHSRSPVQTGARRVVPKKPYVKDISKYVMMPGMAKKRQAVVKERDRVLTEVADSWVRLVNPGRKLGIITSGICYQYVREAFPDASLRWANWAPRKSKTRITARRRPRRRREKTGAKSSALTTRRTGRPRCVPAVRTGACSIRCPS